MFVYRTSRTRISGITVGLLLFIIKTILTLFFRSQVVEQCRKMGFVFEAGSSGALHRSLRALQEQMEEVQFRTVQLLVMGPMQVAQ